MLPVSCNRLVELVSAQAWRPLVDRRELPTVLQPWLPPAGSMTFELERQFQQHLVVDLLASEQRLLRLQLPKLVTDLTPYQYYCREVKLSFKNTAPFIYAMSFCRYGGNMALIQQVKNLNTTPLGVLLFRRGRFQRSQFIYSNCASQTPLGQFFQQQFADLSAVYWLRASAFSADCRSPSLFLLEVFSENGFCALA